MDNVLVLGGDGFIGRNFIQWIRRSGKNNSFRFLGTSLNECRDQLYDDWFCVDLLNHESLKNLINTVKPEYVLNLAGLISSANYESLYAINASVSYFLMDLLAQQNYLRKIVLIGSAAEYGPPSKLPIRECDACKPVSLYGLSKYAQTCYADYFFRQKNLPVVIARTFNIIGPGMPDFLAIGGFATRISAAKEVDIITTGELNARRDYLGIDDVCDAYWRLLVTGNPGSIYNICSGRSFSMLEIIEAMINASQKKLTIQQNSCFTTSGKDVPDIYGSNDLLQKETGWSPVQSVIDIAKELVRNKK